MFALLTVSALLASLARADVSPVAPAPGDLFNQGSTCHIAWTPDTSGAWKTTFIELMTGDNLNMVHLTTVTSLDGTATSTFDYPCPSVTPNSPIYFYQFSSPNSPNRFWTGRFAIADANGNTVPPAQNTQPNGQPIPWGVGALVNPSAAVAPPPYLIGNATISNATVPATSSSTSAIVFSTAPPPPLITTSFASSSSNIPSTPGSTPQASSTATAGANSANGALGGLVVDTRVWHSTAILGVVFAVFL